MNQIKYLLLVVLVIAWGAPVDPAAALAQPGDVGAGKSGVESANRQDIQKIVDILASAPGIDPVIEGKRELKDLISGFNEKIAVLENEIDKLRSALAGINAEEDGGEPVVNQALSELIALKQQKELELAHVRLLLMTAEEALQKLDQYLQRQSAKDHYYRADPLWKLFSGLDSGNTQSVQREAPVHPRSSSTLRFLVLITALFFSLSLFPGVRGFVKESSPPCNGVHVLFDRLSRFSSAGRIVMGITVFSAAALLFAEPLFAGRYNPGAVILIFFSYFVIRLLLRVVILRFKPVVAGDSKGQPDSGEAVPALFVFSLFSAIVVVCSSEYAPRFPSLALDLLLNSLFFLCWLAALYLFTHRCCRTLHAALWGFLKWPLLLLLILIGCLELIGYRNLTDHLIVVFGSTCVVVGFALVIYDSVDMLIELLRRGKDQLLARFLATPAETGHGLKTHKILGIGVKVYVVLGAFILVLHLWGITNTDNERLAELFFDGTSFSGITLSPARITLGLLLFVIFWPAVEYLKQFLEHGWLVSAEMTQSSRDTFLTVSGYAGYAVIILVTLAVAGVKMTGLTVVVGALSVGIGFGLQNIVNNFISGLILIFERPIKKGDWILVGTTEGYVKKISIRSTIVQTFDRADVIVPNSELISNQVTNMMFDDIRGRLRVPVGVAYGSDTELVQRLLLDAAQAHEQVITDGSTPEPRAWFKEFGDSSLNFELLCHLKDIDMKLRVRSELHIAIDKAFRQHGIEIPFPQRDVHLKGNQTK